MDLSFDPRLADLHRAWQRREAFARMRRLGMTYKQIGEIVGLTQGRIRQLVQRAGRRPPVEIYLADNSDIRELADKIKHSIRVAAWRERRDAGKRKRRGPNG